MVSFKRYAWAVGVGLLWSCGYAFVMFVLAFGGRSPYMVVIEFLISLAVLLFLSREWFGLRFQIACLLSHAVFGGFITYGFAQMTGGGGM